MDAVDSPESAQNFVLKYAAMAGIPSSMSRLVVNKLDQPDWKDTWEKVKKEVRKRFGGGKGKLPPKPPMLHAMPMWLIVIVAGYILWKLGD